MSVRRNTAGTAAAVLLMIGVAACASRSPNAPGQKDKAAQTVVATSVTSTERVLTDAQDGLAPLPPGVVPALTAEEVRGRLLQTEGGNAAYLQDASVLIVKVGLYTNVGLLDAQGAPTKNVVSYVFSGGKAPCPPRVGPAIPSGTTPSPIMNQPHICTAVFVANGNDGKGEIESMRGVKGT